MTDSPAPPPPHSPRWTDDLALAVIFMTRLPLRLKGAPGEDANGRAMGWFALVGAGVGLLGGGVYALGSLANLPPMAAALAALAAQVWVTGALHEDGAADVADGFGGGHDAARKLEIMRDSRVGSYGVLAIVFSVAIRASALAALAEPALVAAVLTASGALSRAGLPLVMRLVKPARKDGLAAAQGRPPWRAVWLALGSALVVTVLALGGRAPVALLAALLAGWAVVALARRQIGGHTGDVLGAIQQAGEAAVLLALAALR